jgi:3,4-dihydroxy 2-butanone 4-phosphate synthase / GTP cyclohydrolase II
MYNNIQETIESFKLGNLVIIVDENREIEADLVLAAQYSNHEKITFMLNHTSGIITVPLSEQRAQELQLPLMVKENSEKFYTNFTISVDALHPQMTTGVSSKDRNLTIQTIVNGSHSQLSKPGHIFPLIAKSIQERHGHTETSVQLCKLAGLKEVAVICELMNKNGTMMSKEETLNFAKEHNLKVICIEQLIKD